MKRYILILTCFVLLFPALPAQNVMRLSIDDCQRLAATNSLAVRNADLDVQAAKAQRQEALAEYFPSVSASAFGFHAIDPLLEIGVKDILGTSGFTNNLQYIIDQLAPQYGFNSVYRTMQHGGMASISLMQPVFAGGRIVTGNKLAVLGVKAANLQRNIALRSTTEQIEQQYWQIVALEEKRQTLLELEVLLDTIYRDVNQAVVAGLAADVDMMQVELKRSELHSGKIQLENGIRLAKMNMLNGIGIAYTYIPRADSDLPYIDDIIFVNRLDSFAAPEKYYVNENDVAAQQEETRLLELSVEAKRLEKRMVIGESLPQIAVGASYGYTNILDKGNMNGAVYALVQIPLSDWGKNARKIQRYNYQMEKARNEQEYLSEQILLQIRQLWLNLVTTWQQLQVSNESVKTAQTNADQSLAYYKAGMISLSDLLQAQTALRNTVEEQINQAIAYRTALQAYTLRTGQNL